MQTLNSSPSSTIEFTAQETERKTPNRKTAPVLILASASPRRAELLHSLKLPFILAPVAVAEPRPVPGQKLRPNEFVEQLARFKAGHCDIAAALEEAGLPVDDETIANAVVLAADTIVWHEGEILNKPESEADARQMLRRLRSKTHTVYTGVCLRRNQQECVGHEATLVQFGYVDDAWIDAYVASGEPMDKAGSYAAQGQGALMVERVAGDFWNVVGLPLWRLGQMLAQIGLPVEEWPQSVGENTTSRAEAALNS